MLFYLQKKNNGTCIANKSVGKYRGYHTFVSYFDFFTMLATSFASAKESSRNPNFRGKKKKVACELKP